MAVRSLVQWQPNPGREADTLAAFSEAKRIQEAMGGRARAFQGIADGLGPVVFSYVLETDNMAAYLNILGQLRTSADFRALLQKVVQTPTPAATRVSASVATELPGLESGELTGAPGSLVGSVWQWQVKPGRMAEALEGARTGHGLARGMGATVSVWTNTYAGAGVGLVGAAFLFEGYAAMADYVQKAASNPEWQANLQRAQGPDAPTVLVSNALISELPI